MGVHSGHRLCILKLSPSACTHGPLASKLIPNRTEGGGIAMRAPVDFCCISDANCLIEEWREDRTTKASINLREVW
jgi:hypothetical protein